MIKNCLQAISLKKQKVSIHPPALKTAGFNTTNKSFHPAAAPTNCNPQPVYTKTNTFFPKLFRVKESN